MSRIGWGMMFVLVCGAGCGTSINPGEGSGGSGTGGGGHGGDVPPSTSSTVEPPPLQPNPKNPDGCPSAMPTIGSSCAGGQEGLWCSYIGDLCAEWTICTSNGCDGETVGSSGGTGGGGYYPDCGDYIWQVAPSQELPSCDPVDCYYANDGDPCAVEGDSCSWGDECSSTNHTCEGGTWTVSYYENDCCYDCCEGDCYGTGGSGQTTSVGPGGSSGTGDWGGRGGAFGTGGAGGGG
jgi:hypothetical protein